MEYKKKLRFISLITAGIVIILLLFFPRVLDWCWSSIYCSSFSYTLDNAIAQPLILFSVSVFILSGILYFLREEIFRSWLHFSKWYIFLSFVAILLSTNSSHRVFLNPFETELVAWETSCSYFIISLFLIIYKSIKLRARPEHVEGGK